MEQLDFNLLFRWSVGLGVGDPVWDASTFSKNRDRLLDGSVAVAVLSAVLAIPRVKRLLSQDHFSVDGTLIQAWASMKSFKPEDDGTPSAPPDPPLPPAGGRAGRNAEVDFHGQRLSDDPHRSVTDPEAGFTARGEAGKPGCASWDTLAMQKLSRAETKTSSAAVKRSWARSPRKSAQNAAFPSAACAALTLGVAAISGKP